MKNARILFSLAILALPVFAEEIPSNGLTDPRIKQVVYNARDVVTVTAHYGFSSMIQFAPDETIQTISLGDTLAWNLLPVANTIFLKPIEDHADTNMQVITSRRTYNFALVAYKAKNNNDRNLTFTLVFRYPEDELKAAQVAKAAEDAKKAPDPSEIVPEHRFNAQDVNMEYTFRGNKEIAPRRVFDDGDFTYFYFNEKTETPAIFIANEKNEESLLNFHKKGNYIVVQRLARKFVLRHGDLVTCVYNERYAPNIDREIKIEHVDTPESEKHVEEQQPAAQGNEHG